MLTMGEPIQLKSAGTVGTPGEMFGERIRGNYEQMQGRINPVEMLHFLAAPPELYMMATDMTTLVNRRDGTKIQNLALSLVNNVLNRILVTEQMMFTYQDRVFVENILHRLGVKDVREFIGQVRMIKEETGNIRELLSLYESGRDVIRLIQEYRREHSRQRKRKESGTEAGEPGEEEADRLAVAVQNRLRLGDIYREVSRHAALCYGDRRTIRRLELAFGEQHIAASYLALHDYRSRILAKRQNAFYSQMDPYEAWNISRTHSTYGQTVNQLVQTALLHAVSQLFWMRYTDFSQHADWRYEFMDALHVSAQNTFQRLADFSERASFLIRDKEGYHRALQYFERQEIGALKSLFAGGAEVRDRISCDREEVRTAPQYLNAFFFTGRHDTKTDSMWPENTAPLYDMPVEAAELRLQREKEIRACIARINRQNVERLERLSEYAEHTGEREELRIDREAAKAAGLRVINAVGQERTAHREREVLHETEREQRTEILRDILGDETVRVFDTIRDYRENPAQYPNVTTSEGQVMSMLLRDIAAAEHTQAATTAAEHGRNDRDGVWRAGERETKEAPEKTLRGAQPGERRTERMPGKSAYTVELFHRQNGQAVSEERLQEWRQTWKKDIQMQNRLIRERTGEKEQVTEMVQSKVNEMKARQDEEIARMISLNVKRELDTLSEKVYGKLERRMDGERRRRGM